MELTQKTTTYSFDKEQNIVTFYPGENEKIHKLNGIEYVFASYYSRAGLYFRGKVDIERFIKALDETLQVFSFMFFHYDRDEGIASFKVDSNNNSSNTIQLEIDNREENLHSFSDYLPNRNNDPRMQAFTTSLDGLAIAKFKLTTLIDGFVLGYYMNHAFFDQASIYYLLKYLSHLYCSNSKQTNNLKKPNLLNLDYLYQPLSLKDLSEVRKAGEDYGYFYKPTHEPSTIEYTVVDLYFNTQEMENIKKQTTQFISTNDVIHGIILKLNSFNPTYRDDQEFCLKYNVNMRKPYTLGEEVIGNLVYGLSFMVKLEDMRKKSILELAIANRASLSNIDSNIFKKELDWYSYIKNYKENPLEYHGKSNSIACRVSSWTSFDYDQIRFDDSTPNSIKCPCLAHYGNINMITFDDDEINGQRIITSSIYIPTSCLNEISDLSKSTNLFKTKLDTNK